MVPTLPDDVRPSRVGPTACPQSRPELGNSDLSERALTRMVARNYGFLSCKWRLLIPRLEDRGLHGHSSLIRAKHARPLRRAAPPSGRCVNRSLPGRMNAMDDAIAGSGMTHRLPSRRQRLGCAAAFAASMLIAGSAGAAASPGAGWHGCAAGAGGAMNVSVRQVSCGYASRVTEAGLYPDARRTRIGGFTCERYRDARGRWVYQCLRDQGRQGLAFETY